MSAPWVLDDFARERGLTADQALDRAAPDLGSGTDGTTTLDDGPRPIARRLVWSSGSSTFRLDEDDTFTDVHDAPFVLPPDARVVLPHPLHLEDADAWAEVFADYELLQPFEQLARPAHRLTDADRAAHNLARFSGATTDAHRVLDLIARGWRFIDEFIEVHRALVRCTSGGEATVSIDPGVPVDDPEAGGAQKVRSIVLSCGCESRPYDELDPITASEVLADLTRLTT